MSKISGQQQTNLSPRREQFMKTRGKIKGMFADDVKVRAKTGKGYSSGTVSTIEDYKKLMQNAPSSPASARKISVHLEATNSIYSDIIDYYTNYLLYRYTYTPVYREDININEAMYKRSYSLMTEIVDGLRLELIAPIIMREGMIKGIVNFLVQKNNSSKTISIFMLPESRCKTLFESNFGTGIIQFDFDYFTSVLSSIKAEQREDYLKTFPKILVDGYNAYQKDKSQRYQILDGRYATSINFSASGLPPKLNAFLGLLEYDEYSENELEANRSKLENILVHRIPVYEDTPIFDIEEVRDIHKEMSKIANDTKGLKLLTTFGDSNILRINENKNKENRTLEQAYNGIFDKAGMNHSIFTGDSNESLDIALNKTKGYVMNIMNQLTMFLNLALNNLYNFSPMEIRINMLSVSQYNEADSTEMHLEHATFGIGKLEAVVAAGTKQSEIPCKSRLEQYLALDDILIPLQSAHTQSGKEDEKEDKEEPETKSKNEDEKKDEKKDVKEDEGKNEE